MTNKVAKEQDSTNNHLENNHEPLSNSEQIKTSEIDAEPGDSIKEDEPIEIDDDLSDVNDDTDSDSDSIDSDTPKRVILKIKPIDEVDRSLATTPDMLRQISKNLQLKFNKNNYSKSYKPYSTYTRNTVLLGEDSAAMNKSIADESSTSISSMIVNSHGQHQANSTSPSLWCESQSASTVGFSVVGSRAAPLDVGM